MFNNIDSDTEIKKINRNLQFSISCDAIDNSVH